MASWLKVDANLLRNPKVMQTGKDGALVYLEALAMNQRNGRDGKLHAIEAKPETFAGLLAAYRLTPKACAAALKRVIEVGLLHPTEDGGLQVAGYDDSWRPKCSTCNNPNPDTTMATCPTCRQKRKEKR